MKNKGFINFPINSDCWKKSKRKLWVNIVVFDILNAKTKDFSPYADTHLLLDGMLVCDDVMMKPKSDKSENIDQFLGLELSTQQYENLYFPNYNLHFVQDFDLIKYLSTPFLSSILLGKSDFNYMNDDENWFCTYSDLNEDGKNLYFLIKKLYNNKEVRILTFIENQNF